MPDFYVPPRMDGPIYLLSLTGQGLAQPVVEKRRISNSRRGSLLRPHIVELGREARCYILFQNQR